VAEFSSAKIKHFEMLQKVIDRMAGESGRVKQVALASTAAIVSVSASTHSWWLPLSGVVLTLAFWYLDARYLAQERWFRDLYESERAQDGHVSFLMTPPLAIRRAHNTAMAMMGWSTFLLYAAIILINLATSRFFYVEDPVKPKPPQTGMYQPVGASGRIRDAAL